MLADAVVLIVVGAVALLLPSYRPYRAYLRRRLVHKAGAQVPADQEAFLESRVAVRAQGGGMGIIVAGLCALLLSRTWVGAEEASGGSVLDDAASAAAVVAGHRGAAWSLALLIGGYLAPFVLVGVTVLVTSAGGSRTEMEHFSDRLWGGRTAAGVTGEV